LKKHYLLLLTACLLLQYSFAQDSGGKRRCSTMEVLNRKMKDPAFKAEFEANRQRMYKSSVLNAAKTAAINDTIPVVVHIIMASPETVTDATCQSQIDVLNEDYQGKNADTTRIPAAFKPLFGRGNITFMLAKTSPEGLPTSGIERRVNNITFTADNDYDAKHYASGGMDGWDTKRYFNMWVVKFTDGTLGISVFPGTPGDPYEHGYLCDYRSWGRGPSYLYSEYNKGRTASHEIGHFFNLYHIWGDDDDATNKCLASDFDGPNASWDDTPNQAIETYDNPDLPGTGTVVTDACATTAPGIMYQNYMDYTNDIALVMFTKGQWKRMEDAIQNSPDRNPLLTSNAYNPPPVFVNDAGTPTVVAAKNVCASNSIAPKVKLINFGTAALTSASIYVQLNGGTATLAYTWTGSLNQYDSAVLTMPAITLSNGNNTIRYYTTMPNGVADAYTANDAGEATVNYAPPPSSVTFPITEGFESGVIPAANWAIINPDASTTWTIATVGKTGTKSAKLDNYNYEAYGQFDYLRLPSVNISSALYDSAYFTFQYAYKRYSAAIGDTLEVVASTDCGTTWKSLWKKGGTNLATTTGNVTTAFVPTAAQWSTTPVKVDITAYRNQQAYFALRNKNNYGQIVYVDDINLYTVANPLPVDLSYFNGYKKEQHANVLNWGTATEINSAYFSIERSENAVDFAEIAKVNAAGNSNSPLTYTYTDHQFSPVTNYYRLKLVDKDGKAKYSNVISIRNSDKVLGEVSIYPNPAKDILYVNITAEKKEKMTLQIADIQGRVVSTQNLNTEIGVNATSVNINNLPQGMYTLIVNGTERKVLKFNKQ